MRQRGLVIIVGLVMFGLGAAVGTFGYIWFIGGSGEASQPISAPTLSLAATEAPDPVATRIAQLDSKLDTLLTQLVGQDDAAAIGALGEQISALESQIATLNAALAGIEDESAVRVVTPTPPPTPTPEPTAAPTATSAEAVGEVLTGRSLFRIDNRRSVVRFIINEELEGAPKTVIGATDQVAGDIIVNFDDSARSQVGEIRINMRTLQTDSEFRDRSLRAEILESAKPEFEFASFVPTAITGLPESIRIGQEFSFQLAGDFTIRNITNPVTFTVSATIINEARLDGSGSTQITRDLYNLTIPDVPGVANVANEIGLEIDFVARLVES